MVLLSRCVSTKILSNFRHYSVFTKNTNFVTSLQLNVTSIQYIPQRCLFWEKDRKAGYGKTDKTPFLEQLRDGFKELKSEVKLWVQEQKELLSFDTLVIARPGETDILWCFNNQSVIDNFVATCDSDHNQGYSTCHFEMSKAGRGRFHGYLDIRVPKDGRIKKAGYCAIRSKRVRKSFKRETTYDWNLYNTLVLKVRGDGRSYLLNLSCEGYYDIMWNDIFHYVLYTRGGPYWQVARIPFSKFVLGSKGRLQDKQSRILLDKITHFGISCGDKIPGPFDLEIEYIGLECDPTHEEEFAYELYKTDKYIVNV